MKFLLIFSALLTLLISQAGAQLSESDRVFSAGGGVSSAGSFTNTSVIGEPITSDGLTGVNFTTKVGFIYKFLSTALASITTKPPYAISNTSAKSGGNITDDGGDPITARGVCWNTTGSPTIGDPHSTDGSGTGDFNSNLTSLSPCTKYYVRAYATNGSGTSYGNEVTLFTSIPQYSIALWLNSEFINQLDNTPVTNWLDMGSFNNNAVQTDANRKPNFILNQYNGFPAVRFLKSNFQALSEVLTIPNSPASINSVSTKGLYLVLTTGSDVTTSQVIFEAGGTGSGFNIYISGGKAGFGMWRSVPSVVKKFMEINVSANTTYLAYIEYDGSNIKASLNGSTMTLAFTGLSSDLTPNGVGASYLGTRTNCCNYGSTYDVFYAGLLYEVLLTNDPLQYSCARSYLCGKYAISGCPGGPPREVADNNAWTVYDEENLPALSDNAELTPATPNPSTGNSTFGIMVAEKQNVKIELFDAIGNSQITIYNGLLNQNSLYNFTIDGTELPSGLYLIRATGSNFIQTESVVIIK